MTRSEMIMSFISDDNYKPMKINEIAVFLQVPKNEKEQLKNILNELEESGQVFKNSNGRYALSEKLGFVKGKFYAKSKGYGFVINDNDEKFFVSPSDTFGAFNNDTVLVKVTKKIYNNDKCSECKILKILKHGSDTIVGIFNKNKNFGFVVPDDKSFTSDIYISKKNSASALNGQKVVVKITKWPSKNENPEGVIEEVIGFPNDDYVDIKSIIKQYGFSEKFPEKVELSANAYNDTVSDDELFNREDFRDEMIFTIDGDDSKDFDDAVGIKKTANGYVLGVHIADVSYYVPENSALDIEARKRGTSVYLPGFVVPMLPQKLSNGICSLNPNCNRLTLSVIMYFDLDGNLKEHKICEGVICSKYRLTYNEVSALLEGDKKIQTKYKNIKCDLELMAELSQKLKNKRVLKGSIDFDFPEIKIALNEHGKAIDVYKYNSTVSHKIIEEFMLTANTCIAEDAFWRELPFIYRIHENPSADKINSFKKFILPFGFKFNINSDRPHPSTFANFYKLIKNTNKELLISKMMLRSLMKAKYSNENLGHFGLGFKYYCHFTSPIRRYPDLVIHRIIKECILHTTSDKRLRYLNKFTLEAAKSSSDTELRAMEAERDADDMKKAEFLSDKIGNSYPAIISSITSFGMYAENDYGIEGFISLTDMDDDYYEYNEYNLTLTGKNSKKIYNIGDSINIIVKRADPLLREIDYFIERSDIDG